MKIIDCEQLSPEWRSVKLGLPSASQFHRIMTPKTRKFSEASISYIYELLSEWATAEEANDECSEFMKRGKLQEHPARLAFQYEHDCEVDLIGFITDDNGRYGCSPDGCISGKEGLEIKVMSAVKHVKRLLADDDDYRCQVQGGLWITGWECWHRYTWHPTMPPDDRKVLPDPEFIGPLAECMTTFLERLETERDALIAKGCKPAPKPGERCRFKLDDGRWCLSTNGLTMTQGEWRCARHVS